MDWNHVNRFMNYVTAFALLLCNFTMKNLDKNYSQWTIIS